MAVHTSVFGGVRLTGADAKAFREQIKDVPNNKKATESLQRGRKMMAEFEQHGFVRITPRKR